MMMFKADYSEYAILGCHKHARTGMKLALIIMASLACLQGLPRCIAADYIVGDAYTRHSTAAGVGGKPWQSPHRISWQHDLSDSWATDVGIGTNSYGTGSANAGLMWQPLSVGPLKAGAWASLVSGYTCEQLKTCVLAGGLIATLQAGKVVTQVMYVPAIGKGTTAITQLRVGLAF